MVGLVHDVFVSLCGMCLCWDRYTVYINFYVLIDKSISTSNLSMLVV